jgi:hypothetical protein
MHVMIRSEIIQSNLMPKKCRLEVSKTDKLCALKTQTQKNKWRVGKGTLKYSSSNNFLLVDTDDHPKWYFVTKRVISSYGITYISLHAKIQMASEGKLIKVSAHRRGADKINAREGWEKVSKQNTSCRVKDTIITNFLCVYVVRFSVIFTRDQYIAQHYCRVVTVR